MASSSADKGSAHGSGKKRKASGTSHASAREQVPEEHAEAPGNTPETIQIEGPAVPAVRRGLRGVLFYLSGAGLLHALARAAWWLIGGRTTHELRTEGKGLRIRTRRTLLHRTVHLRERRHRISDVDSVVIGQGFAGWPLWLGAIAFSVGVLLGGSWLAEGARTGETYILIAGAVVLLVGSGLDFIITLWHRARDGRSSLSVRTWDGRTICLGGLDHSQSQKFVRSLGMPQ